MILKVIGNKMVACLLESLSCSLCRVGMAGLAGHTVLGVQAQEKRRDSWHDEPSD